MTRRRGISTWRCWCVAGSAAEAQFKRLLTPACAARVAQQDVANRKRRTLDVELDDLASVRAPARRGAAHGRSRF